MAKLPTFTKWSMAFINFIGACNMTFINFVKPNSRGLIAGSIFTLTYIVIFPVLYHLLNENGPRYLFNIWISVDTLQNMYNAWLLGFYPSLTILGFLCTKPTQSANGWKNAKSGLISGLISTLPLLIPVLLLLAWRFMWMECLIFAGNFMGKEHFVGKKPLYLAIYAALLFPVPFVGALGGMIKNLYFHFTHSSDSPVKSLMQIAEQGDVQAQLDLAKMYYDEKDAPQDYIEAAKWLTKAANQGNAEAQCGLGIIYFDGLGTEKDYKTAAEWWTKAANQGYERAQKNLEVMHDKGLIPKWIMATKGERNLLDSISSQKKIVIEQSDGIQNEKNTSDNISAPKKGMGWLLPVFLLTFGILGWHTAMCFVMLIRSLFGGGIYFLVRLGYFSIFIVLTLFAFYKFQIIRQNRGPIKCFGINTLVMGLVIFLMSAIIWRLQWISPMQKFIKTFEDERLACQKNVKEVLSVSGVTESHVPGSGYILVKATLLAKQPLIIGGEDWVPKDLSSHNHPFSSVPEWTELQAGQPKEINIAIVNAANRKYVPALTADGPYFFPEIRVWVTNPALSENSCKVTLIRGLTTKAYKASEFGTAAIYMPGDKPEFGSTVIHLPGGKKISPSKITRKKSKPKPSDEDPLEKEARKLLQDAEQLLDEVNKVTDR